MKRQPPIGGYYYNLHQDCHKVMRPDEACLVAYLLHFSQQTRQDWVPCHTPTIEGALSLNRRQQDWILSKLKVKGFVSTERRGSPSKRWVKVNVDKIESEIKEETHRQCATKCTDNVQLRRRTDNVRHISTNTILKLNTAARSGPMSSIDEDDTMFDLPVDTIPPKYNEDDIRRTKELKSHARKVGYPIMSKTPAKWEIQFRILRQQLPLDQAELIDKVLSWFCVFKNRTELKAANLPTGVSNGEHFRARWDWILTAYEKDQKVQSLKVTISKETKSICKRLQMLPWPKVSDSDLEAAVQISMNRYEMWWAKLDKIAKRSEKIPTGKPNSFRSDRNVLFARRCQSMLGGSSFFIERWFTKINDRIRRWEAFSGKLDSFLFCEDHKEFLKLGEEESNSYSCSTRSWELLTQEINSDR